MRLERQVEIKHAVGSAEERRHNARVTAQVALCRMLMATVVVPIAIVVLGVSFDSPIEDKALSIVRAYSFEAFPQWAQSHHEEACPRSIDELSPLIAREHALDPWGTPIELRCGEPIRGAYIRSAGPDRAFETDDDISSNAVP